MSKFSKSSKKSVSEYREHGKDVVKNFMGGNSYKLDPLNTLRVVASSSIFGEPSYYRSSHDKISNLGNLINNDVLGIYTDDVETTTDVFTKAIDESLSYDFIKTLELARELRKEYFMRLNPSVIFIRAAQHPNRGEFNKENPGLMRKIGYDLIIRPDDITNQFDYYMWLNVTKKGLPSIVKRVWADSLSDFDAYRIKKYKSKSLVDLVRISHAKSEVIDELMTTGDVKVDEKSSTWETLRSKGMGWVDILNTIKMPHMALLRNLRGIFTEVEDLDLAKDVCELLKSGVINGKQFPFRYYTAYKALQEGVNHYGLLRDTLEECMDLSIENTPKLKGKTICLSDNSGSAHGTLNSEYGSTKVAEIGNLSSIMTSVQSDEGYVGVFGDNLSIKPTSKRNGILTQLEETNSRGLLQGMGTENGIWIFFRDAIKDKTHYDNIFIYSDMQANHSQLFGINPSEYSEFVKGKSHIDVFKLLLEYKRTVNPKVNYFSVQTAGYDNSLVTINLERGGVLSGWTGKETTFAKSIIDIWDDVEKVKENKKEVQ